MAPVHKKIIMNNAGVEALLQQKLGLRELDVQVFDGDREILFEDKSGSQYTLYIDSEGLWSFTDDNYTPEQASLPAQESMIEKAKAIVDELAIQPKDAKFTVLENGQFEWSLPNSDDLSIDYWAGDLTLVLKQDGSVYSLTYNLQKKQFIREVNILSPIEVYERIKQGEFPQIKRNALITEEQLVIKKGDRLEVETIKLSHMYDSKGFYQPIYRVSGKFNGDDWFTLIQARR